MADNMVVEKLISSIREDARQSWSGNMGEKRADEVEKFVRELLKDYSTTLGFSEDEILTKLEERRDYTTVNYYQRANFPLLKDVNVYKTIEQLRSKFPSHKFVCPNCGGISTNPVTCNSGTLMDNGKPCDWKAWGLFRTLGKGHLFVVTDDFLANPTIHEIFMPLELQEVDDG